MVMPFWQMLLTNFPVASIFLAYDARKNAVEPKTCNDYPTNMELG